MFDCGPLFLKNKDSKADIVINQGGTDSGKTYALIQLLYYTATTPAPKDDPIITIVSKSIPDSKKGAYRTAKSIYNTNDYLKEFVRDWNETDRTIYFKSGWIMEFTSYQDEQTAKQGKRQYLFINEAQGISYPIFWQLAKRTRKKVFIDYNPTAPFWAHEKLIGTTKDGNDLNASVELIISDHRHNPFLSQKDHDKTENIKDKELWRVYARGMTGNLSGLIYPNWKMIPDKDFPFKEDGKFGGLDFGYTNDPTAGVLCVRIANKIYLHELCYTTAMTPNQLKVLFNSVGFTPETPIYCEHDGDMIRQLRQLELLAIAARKGQGSINAGISKVNEYEIYYTESSKNLDFERKRYMWMTDPDSGKSINTPIDKDNHILDAARYAIYTHFYRAE